MADECMLTTFDNPFDPFEQFTSWYMFDVEKGYNTCSRLARVTHLSSEFTQKETDEEVERIVNSYVKCLQYSVDVSYVVTSFINMYKQGKVNHVISYYFTKANYKSKLNSNIVGVENIVCNFNADSYRELCFKVTPDNKKFNPLSDMELYMVEDSARIFWNLYMLLVFYKVCGIAPYNEHSFFEHFHNFINF